MSFLYSKFQQNTKIIVNTKYKELEIKEMEAKRKGEEREAKARLVAERESKSKIPHHSTDLIKSLN